ncbi:MAG: diaminopimelate epimerase [Symbiobacteriia bacterium]
MEGLGNDYIFVNGFEEKLNPAEYPAISRAVSDRHFGIGADGLIMILPPDASGADGKSGDPSQADFRMRIFNADGSEAEMCGNGIRSFSKYVYDRGLTKKTELRVVTGAGIMKPSLIVEDGRVTLVRVDMGEPRLRRSLIPMTGTEAERVLEEALVADGQEYRVTAISMGNPHIIIHSDDVNGIDLERIGPKLERHPAFPNRTNVHFAEVLGPGEIRMRTWERGSGVTLACGTGACSVAVASALNGRTRRRVHIHLPGGDLDVEWSETDNHVYMTGPAAVVCDGVFLKPW